MVTDTPAVPASPAPVPDAVRQVDSIDDQFFALIYSDEELLRQEFAEMIAAAWSSPPPATNIPSNAGSRVTCGSGG